MIKLVVENTSPEARKRMLEARVQVAFAKAASTLLRMLSGKRVPNIVEVMAEFVRVCELAEVESGDGKSVQLRFTRLDNGKTHEDEHVNAILRGALNVVAERLSLTAKHRLNDRDRNEPTKTELKAYHKARDQLADGINLLWAKTQQSKRKGKSARS